MSAQFYLGAYNLTGKTNKSSATKLTYLIDRTPNEHIGIIAPSRSGKGVGYVIPNLLIWPDSAIVYDPKDELWEQTSGWRESQGHNCIRLNLTKVFAHLNPFSEIDPNSSDALKQIDQILTYLEKPNIKSDPFFSDHGRRFLKLCILHSMHAQKTVNLNSIAYLLTNYDKENNKILNVKELLAEMSRSKDIDVSSEAEYFLSQMKSEAFVNWMANASILVAIFKEKALGEVTSKSDFKISDIANINKKPTTLYIQIAPDETILKRYEPIIRIIFNIIFVNGIYKTGLREKIRLNNKEAYNKRNILIMIDEFHQLGEFRPLERALSDVGGYGGKLCLITQGDKQIDLEYNNQHSFWTSVNHLIFFRPNDIKTTNYICERLGKFEEEVPIETRIIKGSRHEKDSGVNTTVQTRITDLLMKSEIDSLPDNQSIILSKGLRILAHKIDYRTDKELLRRQQYGAAKKYNVINEVIK